MRTRHVALGLAVAALAAAAPQARAVTLDVGSAHGVGNAVRVPGVVALGGGAGVVVSPGDVVRAQRLSADGTWSGPELLAPEMATGVQVAANARGDVVAAWHVVRPENEPWTRMHLAVAPAGGEFGEAETIPLPPRGPIVHENVTGRFHGTNGVDVEIGPAGEVVVTYHEGDYATETSRIVAVRRSVDGTFAEPQVLAARQHVGSVQLAMDDAGVAHAMWSASDPDNPRQRLAHHATAAPGGAFGAPVVVSEPDLDADNGISPPQISVNPAGDALAVWNPLPIPTHPFPGFPDRVSVARRPAGGQWSPPERITPGDRGAIRPFAALGPAGHALVVWYEGYEGISGRVAAPGGAFTPLVPTPLDPSATEAIPVALDGGGRAVAVHRGETGNKRDRIMAYAKDPDGCFATSAEVSPAPTHGWPPALDLAPDGTGLIAWTNQGEGLIATVRIAPGGAPQICLPPEHGGGLPPFVFKLGTLPPRADAARLRRDGIRLRLLPDQETTFAAVLTVQGPKRRGRRPKAVIADHRALPYKNGPRVVRLRVPRKLHRTLRRGALLKVTVAGADGGGRRAVRSRSIRVR